MIVWKCTNSRMSSDHDDPDKDNDFIFVRFVVIFIKSQEFIDPQIRIHTAYTIHKNVGTTILVFDRDMINDTLMYK